MRKEITFGTHEGKTFEWIFFNAGGYVKWLVRNGAINRPDKFNLDEEEAELFRELYYRAKQITGVCTRCGTRSITRMGLGYLKGTGQMAQVGFYCDECEYFGGTQIEYYPASFFIDDGLRKREHQNIADEIKRKFIGDGNLTQGLMEEYFRNDANFLDATPGFFTRSPYGDEK